MGNKLPWVPWTMKILPLPTHTHKNLTHEIFLPRKFLCVLPNLVSFCIGRYFVSIYNLICIQSMPMHTIIHGLTIMADACCHSFLLKCRLSPSHGQSPDSSTTFYPVSLDQWTRLSKPTSLLWAFSTTHKSLFISCQREREREREREKERIHQMQCVKLTFCFRKCVSTY